VGLGLSIRRIFLDGSPRELTPRRALPEQRESEEERGEGRRGRSKKQKQEAEEEWVLGQAISTRQEDPPLHSLSGAPPYPPPTRGVSCSGRASPIFSLLLGLPLPPPSP